MIVTYVVDEYGEKLPIVGLLSAHDPSGGRVNIPFGCKRINHRPQDQIPNSKALLSTHDKEH